MRYAALDIGSARIGVAISDDRARVASPLKVLDARRVRSDPTSLRRIIEEYEVAEVVVGLPLSLDGSEGPQARAVRDYVEKLSGQLPCPVTFFDERLSSAEAERAMAQAGLDVRGRRGKVDMVAAALILQAFLDSKGVAEDRSR